MWFLLTGCTEEGYPSTADEMWAVTIIFLGVLVLFGWCAWLIYQFIK